jgi:hypothetical protein
MPREFPSEGRPRPLMHSAASGESAVSALDLIAVLALAMLESLGRGSSGSVDSPTVEPLSGRNSS